MKSKLNTQSISLSPLSLHLCHTLSIPSLPRLLPLLLLTSLPTLYLFLSLLLSSSPRQNKQQHFCLSNSANQEANYVRYLHLSLSLSISVCVCVNGQQVTMDMSIEWSVCVRTCVCLMQTTCKKERKTIKSRHSEGLIL